MGSGVACVFPTFPMRTREFNRERLPGYDDALDRLAGRAARVVPIHARTFDHPPREALEASVADTLRAHYACFLESTAMAEWIECRVPPCEYVAGYSMGLFAALAYSGAMAFEDVLLLMHGVCVDAHHVAPPGAYAVGAVVGLDVNAVTELIAGSAVEITDVYGAATVLVTGGREAVVGVLNEGLGRGAVATRLIPVTAPFHATALTDVEPLTVRALAEFAVTAPRRPIVSAITQQVLATAGEIRAEVPRNVCRAMNWYTTMHTLISLGARCVIECGASTSLTELARGEFADSCASQDFRDFESGSQ